MTNELDVQPHLDRLVEQLKSAGAIRSARVEEAMRTVQRHRFLGRFYKTGPQGMPPYEEAVIDAARPSAEHLDLVYSDAALTTRLQNGMPSSSTSQPEVVACMLELLDLEAGMKVLEIGAGTGYNAALMAELVRDHRLVWTVDIQPDVVEQSQRFLEASGYGGIHVLERDGYEGVPESGPFDRIVATVGCPDLAPAWTEQLASGGFALIPLEHAGYHPLTKVWSEGGEIRGEVVGLSGFMQIQGELAHAGIWPRTAWLLTVAPPMETRPLWLDLQKEEYADLTYFLGLVDRRACGAWNGVGVVDESNQVLIGEDEVKLFGSEAEQLLTDLRYHFEEWERLGRPRMSDYDLRFVNGGEAPSDCRWRIERNFFVQCLRLGAPRAA